MTSLAASIKSSVTPLAFVFKTIAISWIAGVVGAEIDDCDAAVDGGDDNNGDGDNGVDEKVASAEPMKSSVDCNRENLLRRRKGSLVDRLPAVGVFLVMIGEFQETVA